MSDPLSIDNLVKRLQAEIDEEVRWLCDESERLSRQGDFRQAIWLAQSAANIAAQSRDATATDILARERGFRTTGVAFLRLAIVRHLSPFKAERERALIDSETSLRWLKLDRHNSAIGELVHARMLIDNDKVRAALRYYHQVSQSLDDLRQEWYRKNDPVKESEYRNLRRAVLAAIERVQFALPSAEEPSSASTVLNESEPWAEPEPAEEVSSEPAEMEPYAHSLFVRTSEWQRIPIFDVAVWGGLPGGAFATGVNEYVEIEVNQVMVNGKAYTLHSVARSKTLNGSLRLHRGKHYAVMPVKGDSMTPRLQPGDYVLVREQNNHDFDGQLVVVKPSTATDSDPVENIVKCARGYPDIQALESDNPVFSSLRPSEALLLGVVDAALKPMSSDHAEEPRS